MGTVRARMGTGRKKIEIKPISNVSQRRVTFTKRRQGLFKKMAKNQELTGCKAFALVFSPSGTPFTFGDVELAEPIGIYGGSSGVVGGVVGECGPTGYSCGSPFTFGDLALVEAVGNSERSGIICGVAGSSTSNYSCGSALGFGVEGPEVCCGDLNTWMAEGSVLPLLEGPMGSEDGQGFVDQFALQPLPLAVVEESSSLPLMAVEEFAPLPLMTVEESLPLPLMAVHESSPLPLMAVHESLPMPLMDVEESSPFWAIQESDLNWDFGEPSQLKLDDLEPLPMWAVEEELMNFDTLDDSYPLY